MTKAVGMHAETFAILRHIEVHGPRTRDEIIKGLKQASSDVTKRTANLAAMGYIAKDATTHPLQFTLTHKARTKLASQGAPTAPVPTPAPKPKRTRSQAYEETLRLNLQRIRAMGNRRVQQAMSAPYSASEYRPSSRPGAMQFTLLPSRMGDTLRYRDGRVTDMAGNPLPSVTP